MPETLELPRPLPLLRTAGWNLAESVGLPIAAYAIGVWLGGRNAGLWTGLAAIWVTAAIRKLATNSVPGLVTISVIVLTIQTAAAIGTGNLWIFLLHFPLANFCLFILFARTARGPKPLCAQLANEMIGLRRPASRQPGLDRFFRDVTFLWAGNFLLLAAVMGVLLKTERTPSFLLLSAIATIALIAVGIGASALWFRWVLRRLGIRLRFAPVTTPTQRETAQATGSRAARECADCWEPCWPNSTSEVFAPTYPTPSANGRREAPRARACARYMRSPTILDSAPDRRRGRRLPPARSPRRK